jgi:hypothetical protein
MGLVTGYESSPSSDGARSGALQAVRLLQDVAPGEQLRTHYHLPKLLSL